MWRSGIDGDLEWTQCRAVTRTSIGGMVLKKHQQVEVQDVRTGDVPLVQWRGARERCNAQEFWNDRSTEREQPPSHEEEHCLWGGLPGLRHPRTGSCTFQDLEHCRDPPMHYNLVEQLSLYHWHEKIRQYSNILHRISKRTCRCTTEIGSVLNISEDMQALLAPGQVARAAAIRLKWETGKIGQWTVWKALVTTRGRFSEKENGGRIFFSGGPDYVSLHRCCAKWSTNFWFCRLEETRWF